MYIRRERKQLKLGSRTYVSVAHNVREKREGQSSRVKPIVLMNLGDEEEADPAMVEGVIGALRRYLAKRRSEKAGTTTEAALAQAVADEVAPHAAGIRKLVTKSLGLRTILEAAWKDLGIDKALRGFGKEHRITFPFERVIFALVWNRIADPKSKLAVNDWIKDDVCFPEGVEIKLQHIYRSLDTLEEHNEEFQAKLLEALTSNVPESDWNTDCTDTTSTYYESSVNDEERAEIAKTWERHDKDPENVPKPHWPRPQVVNDPPLRMQGHSKDSRPHSPQVKIGLIANPDGFVKHHQVVPGNKADGEIALDLVEGLERFTAPERRTWVGDSGMGTGPVLDELDNRDGLDRVSSKSLRETFVREKILGKQGRYRKHPEKEGWSLRIVHVSKEESPHGRDEQWIVTRNDLDRARRIELIEKQVKRVKAALAKDDRIDGRKDGVFSILASDALKKYVKLRKPRRKKRVASENKAPPGRYVLHVKRIREELQHAGLRALCSTNQGRDPLDVIADYRALLKTEADFKDFKGPLRLRPMYHRADLRIRAHVLVCVIAVNLMRYLEKKTGLRFAEIKEIWKGHTAALMRRDEHEWWLRDAYTQEQQAMLEKLGVKPMAEAWTT